MFDSSAGIKGRKEGYLTEQVFCEEKCEETESQQGVDRVPACIIENKEYQQDRDDDDDEPAAAPVGKSSATFGIVPGTISATSGCFFVFIIVIASFVGVVSAVTTAESTSETATAIEICQHRNHSRV